MTVIIEATMCIHMKMNKVAAVKAIREMTGLGLAESKRFVEQNNGLYVLIRMTPKQFGIANLIQHEWAKANADRGYDENTPSIAFHDVRRIDSQPEHVIDFTKN